MADFLTFKQHKNKDIITPDHSLCDPMVDPPKRVQIREKSEPIVPKNTFFWRSKTCVTSCC